MTILVTQATLTTMMPRTPTPTERSRFVYAAIQRAMLRFPELVDPKTGVLYECDISHEVVDGFVVELSDRAGLLC